MKQISILLLALFASTASASPPIFGIDQYNIEVTGMEISQGIQNLDNAMPLVADRKIIVRVYARETTGRTVSNVIARLDAGARYLFPSPEEGGGGEGGGYGVNLFSQPVTVTPMGGSRLNYGDSFNFEFELSAPAEVLSPMTANFKVTLNHNRLGEEENVSDNVLEITDKDLFIARDFKIHFVPVHLHQNPANSDSTVYERRLFDGTNDSYIINSMLRYMPIADSTDMFSWQTDALLPPNHDTGVEWDLTLSDDRHAVNSSLREMELLDDEGRQYHGLIHSSVATGGYAGWASNYGNWSKLSQGVRANSPWHYNAGATLAHEMMHGIDHMPCSGTESRPDTNYPWPNDPPNSVCQLANLDINGYYGLDTYYVALNQAQPVVISNDPSVPEPNQGFPFMGYKKPRWVSPYEYCKMLPRFDVPCDLVWPGAEPIVVDPEIKARLKQNLEALDHTNRYVWVSLLLDDEAKSVDAFKVLQMEKYSRYEIERNRNHRKQELENGKLSNWGIVITDRNDQVLVEHFVADVHAGGDIIGTEPPVEEGKIRSFTDLIAFPAGAAKVQVYHKDSLIATKSMSLTAPRVRWESDRIKVLHPGSVLKWQGIDDDGDTLQYTLLYSADGKHFKPVRLNMNENHLVVSRDMLFDLKSSTEGQFKVLVSDGFHTGEAVSGRLKVPPRPQLLWTSSSFARLIDTAAKASASALIDLNREISSILDWTN